MSRRINLLFGVHNHQPVGNFPGVFENADRNCYHPFIDILYHYPEVKLTLHFSGSLIDWLLKNDLTLLEKVRTMVKRGQVEILTGGYFEPILSIIPERDRLGQIRMLSNFIEDYFEFKPQGAWIGERVWKPELTKSLVQTGVRYILLDDFLFLRAGIKEKDLLGYYIVKEGNYNLAVFPINKRLRYIIPFSAVSQPIEYLRRLADREAKAAATIVDDGEKFGLWPGTSKWVYQEKWLDKFFQQLLKNQDWLKTRTISEYMREYQPLGICHLPPGSYEEMISWSGGAFENFFSKYPEANNLHKRMLYVSRRLAKTNHQEAQRYLYMGQCNCPYWHGVFGGIYLGHLRHTAYKNLLSAQSILDRAKGPVWAEIEVLDFDGDGVDEVIIKNPSLNAFVAPALGGGILELDYLPKSVNLTDVMTRRPEPYHEKIAPRRKAPLKFRKKAPGSIHDLLGSKEQGLQDLLIYDSYRRLSLLDHFLPGELSLPDFKNVRYEEQGTFINAQYSLKQKREKQKVSISLQRAGEIKHNGEKIPLRLSKSLSLNDRDAQLCIEYHLENLSARPAEIVLGVEFNISPDGQGESNNLSCRAEQGEKIYSLKEDLQVRGVERLCLKDAVSGVKTIFYFEHRPNLWSYPLETISASEQGFERNYQHTVILPFWRIKLEKTWQSKITITICNLDNVRL